MPSFANFKTTNTAYWPRVNGVPAWKLNQTLNAWDALMDQIAAAVGTFVPYTPAGVTAAQTVGASPWTHTASTAPEVVYISPPATGGGAVSSVTRNGTPITNALPVTVLLPPGGSLVIQYTGNPPLVVVDK